MGCYPTFMGKMTPFLGRRGIEGDRGYYCSTEARPCLTATRTSPARSWTFSLAIKCVRCFSTVFTLITSSRAIPPVGAAFSEELQHLALPGG